MTSTAAGWILAEGHGANGTVLDHGTIGVRTGAGFVNTAEQVADEVFSAHAKSTTGNDRLSVIGVTWSDNATAEAALLLEALTDAGFDNVVLVRLLKAVEALAGATASVIGFQQIALCVLDDDWATAVMVDTREGGETQTASKHVRGGLDGLVSWLTGMFDRNAWRPSAVVIIGSDSDIHAISWQLEETLPVPVFMQANAPLAVAHGAALAAAGSTEFTDAGLVAATAHPQGVPVRSRRLSYTGALTGLVAGAVTLVASLSLAVGLQLAPERESGAPEKGTRTSAPHVAAVAQTPAPPPPPAVAVPPATAGQPPSLPAPEAATPESVPAQQWTPQPAPSEEPAVRAPVATPVAQDEQTNAPAGPSPEPTDPPTLLTRLLEHLQGLNRPPPAPTP